MRKLFLRILLLTLPFAFSACGLFDDQRTPYGYVKSSFGIPTAGYASANQSFPMADGYTLLITIGCDVARTGEVFCDDPIAPDVETNTPLEDAVAWIQSR